MHGDEELQRHGVSLAVAADGTMAVSSARLPLPWRPRTGRVPGTAVLWDDRLFEVVVRRALAAGERWELRPWPEGEAMRHGARLDAASLTTLAAELEREQRRARHAKALHLLLPLSGLLPARLQRHWERELAHPARRAVVASALCEIVFATLVPLQLVSLIFHDALLKGGWRWLVVPAFIAGAEAVGRLIYLRVTGEPIGSLFASPVLLFLPREEGASAGGPAPPAVAAFDPERGLLSLASPTLRGDWTDGGVLEYRGKPYRLHSLTSHAAPWVYRFEALTDAVPGEAPRLRLSPPAAGPVLPSPRGLPESLPKTVFKMVVFALAPGHLQAEWTTLHHLPPRSLTFYSAAFETFGGIFNLVREPSGAVWFALLDLFFVGEGALRLALALATHEPVGSVFGAPFLGLYPRWVTAAKAADGNAAPPANRASP